MTIQEAVKITGLMLLPKSYKDLTSEQKEQIYLVGCHFQSVKDEFIDAIAKMEKPFLIDLSKKVNEMIEDELNIIDTDEFKIEQTIGYNEADEENLMSAEYTEMYYIRKGLRFMQEKIDGELIFRDRK